MEIVFLLDQGALRASEPNDLRFEGLNVILSALSMSAIRKNDISIPRQDFKGRRISGSLNGTYR